MVNEPRWEHDDSLHRGRHGVATVGRRAGLGRSGALPQPKPSSRLTQQRVQRSSYRLRPTRTHRQRTLRRVTRLRAVILLLLSPGYHLVQSLQLRAVLRRVEFARRARFQSDVTRCASHGIRERRSCSPGQCRVWLPTGAVSALAATARLLRLSCSCCSCGRRASRKMRPWQLGDWFFSTCSCFHLPCLYGSMHYST
jgi:hypothetical protein